MTHPASPGPQDRLHRDGSAGSTGPVSNPDAMPVIRPEMGLTAAQGASGPAAPAPPAGGVEYRRPSGETQFVSVFGDCDRSGPWSLADASTAVSTFGDIRLDLREVDLGAETRISAYGCFGDVKIIVTPDVDVQLRGVAICGDSRIDKRSEPRIQPRRTLIVDGFNLFGDVAVLVLSAGREAPKRWRWS